ncbi:hypothetical protein LTR17_007782 [Elasticomyces elasticus]|nr:hypothetical protein LTR17_007782 [Elasticomyces elasticus]
MKNDSSGLATPNQHSTINQRYYAASTVPDGISFGGLHHGGKSEQLHTGGLLGTSVTPLIELSQVAEHRLAVSSREQLHVYDLETRIRTHVLPGSGRVISSLAFHPQRPETVASGAIDGTVCLWDLAKPALPILQLRYVKTACTCISLSPLQDVIATVHGGSISVWSLQRPYKRVRAIHTGLGPITRLSWHPSISGRLLSVSAQAVCVWEVADALPLRRPTRSIDDDSDDEECFFGELDGFEMLTSPIARLEVEGLTGSADWFGEHGMHVSLPSRSEVRIYSSGPDWEMLHEVWRAMLKFEALAVVIHSVDSFTTLTAVASDESQSYRIPTTILDELGGHTQRPSMSGSTPSAYDFASRIADSPRPKVLPAERDWPTNNTLRASNKVPSITPVSIASMRAERGTFAKTSVQLQQRRRGSSGLSKVTAIAATSEVPSLPATPVSKAMTSSLELPQTRDDDEDSLIPFLSPFIPARKPSPNTAPRIEESTDLPSLQSTSFDSLVSTEQDSESDDETLAGGMRNSSRLLPGGINVPLPRTCGALFAPNGQLLTFHTPRPRPATPSAVAPQHNPANFQRRARTMAGLFPKFGEILSFSDNPESDDDESDGSSLDGMLISSAIQPLSFERLNVQSTEALPPQSRLDFYHADKTIVSVHDLEDSVPTYRAVAQEYRIFCAEEENGSDLCRHNANVADSAGPKATARIWRLVALLLEDKVPLRQIERDDTSTNILFVARQAIGMSHSEVGIDKSGIESLDYGKLRWADSPLGRTCLLMDCFDWAESKADIQLLALLSAVLVEAESRNSPSFAQALAMPYRSPTYSRDYVAYVPLGCDARTDNQAIPISRHESQSGSLMYGSPIKLQHSSQIVSRTPSLPSTPHMDSTSSTPPLSLPSFSRQNTKLSGSGSGSGGTASPDHHRSSFSAAARHYAQSITDKFGSYGTSPPLKKNSFSPGPNELSTSLSSGGSWSKSVSFASNASTTRDSQLSQSYGNADLDGYDSDRTVEDTSLPHTPKLGPVAVLLQLPNSEMFTDDITGSAKLPLLSSDLASKAVLWRSYYAEQLRCWGLLMQAAELEKVSGIVAGGDRPGVHLFRAPKQRKPECSICFAVAEKLLQVCPACLHTTHLRCLSDYAASMEDGEDFECPTGCGCQCTVLPYEHTELQLPTEEAVKDAMKEIAPKRVWRSPSFTDPRRWRARVEGESW